MKRVRYNRACLESALNAAKKQAGVVWVFATYNGYVIFGNRMPNQDCYRVENGSAKLFKAGSLV